MVITRAYVDDVTEIVIYETDRLVIVINRDGMCVTRISISPDALTGPITDLRIEPPKEQPDG